MSGTIRKVIVSFTSLLTVAAATVGAQEAPQRGIEHVVGDLYRWQNGAHYGVLYVTEEGVLVGDTINAEASAWVKAQITERWGKPVKYVVYSHHHEDHASGGEVFADTATFVGHANGKKHFEEGGYSPAPSITFEDRTELQLDGKTIELIYPGRSHTDNLIVMRFPGERALFVVDVAATKRLPYRTFPGFYMDDAFATFARMEMIDFDILVGGHGAIGTKQDMRDHFEYVRILHRRVKEAIDNEVGPNEAQDQILMEEYADWGRYEEWRALNVLGMYNHIVGP